MKRVLLLSTFLTFAALNVYAADLYVAGGGGGGGSGAVLSNGGLGGAGKGGRGANGPDGNQSGGGGGGAYVGDGSGSGGDGSGTTGGLGSTVSGGTAENGADAVGSIGGNGGSASYILQNSSYDNVYIAGGNSSGNQAGSFGGDGGSATTTGSGNFSFASLSVTGGDADGMTVSVGGDALLAVDGNLAVSGAMAITAGSAHHSAIAGKSTVTIGGHVDVGGDLSMIGGGGVNGNIATLTLTNAGGNLTVAGDVNIASGVAGSQPDMNSAKIALSGGNMTVHGDMTMTSSSDNASTASLTGVNVLRFENTGTATITLDKQTGASNDLRLSVNTLDLSGATAATFVLTNITPEGSSSGVNFGDIWLAKTTAITQDGASAFDFRGLTVSQKNTAFSYSKDGMPDSILMTGKTLSFLLPADVADGDVMLDADLNVGGATVNILSGSHDLTQWVEGDAITLVNGNLTGTIANNGTNVSAQYGSSLYYFDVSSDALGIYAAFGAARTGEYAKAYLESGMAKLGQMAVAYDTFLGQLAGFSSRQNGTYGFGTIGGYDQKLKSGSHVDAMGVNLSTGGYVKNDQLLAGAFFEAGWGSYDSFNSFSSLNVKGDGDTSFYGLGGFAKYDLPKNFYIEGSIRTGYALSDFSSGDLTNASFDADGWYYGMHGGVGYDYAVTEKGKMNPYALLIWTHQWGDSADPISGEHVKLDAVDSLRTRVGARYTHEIAEFKAYGGAAWEYEFDGKQTGSLNGTAIASPDMMGSTGVFELGADWMFAKAWVVNVNLSGLVGKREGVAGALGITYAF